MSGIGLLNEKPLHASLKQWCAQPGDAFEVPVDGYVVDIVRDDLLLEIQTGGFASIRLKLSQLIRSRRLRLVYPIATETWIVRLAEDGSRVAAPRKSPRRGRVEDLFWDMVSIPQLIANGNLSVEVLLTREEEARRFAGRRGWRRKGWVVAERRLLEVVDRRLFSEPADWLALLPESRAPFTARDLSASMGIRLDLAQKMAYCLREAQLVQVIGQRGRARLYAVAPDTAMKRTPHARPSVVVVMGPTGAGKSTVGRALAARLGWTFVEGDDLHPPANVAKMRRNEPLTDDDRAAWLGALRRIIAGAVERSAPAVVACSALKRRYREALRGEDGAAVRFVYLEADAALLRARAANRSGHFAGAGLVASQLETLEDPRDEALTVDARAPVDEIVARVRKGLGV